MIPDRTSIRWEFYKDRWNPFRNKFAPDTYDFKQKEKTIKMATDLVKGSSTQVHRAATEKLQELGVDPIEELIQQLKELQEMLDFELGTTKPRSLVINNLVNLRVRILETLLPYRYGKAPQMTIESQDIREPIRIILSNE